MDSVRLFGSKSTLMAGGYSELQSSLAPVSNTKFYVRASVRHECDSEAIS